MDKVLSNTEAEKKVGYKEVDQQPDGTEADTIQFVTTIHNFTTFTKKHSSASNIYNFISSARINQTSDQKEAVTWKELYTLYRSRGYSKPILDNPNKARSRATVDMQVKEFKKANGLRGETK